MNYTKAILLVICAFVLSLLDTSFFSAMPLFGATIISAFVLALTLSMFDQVNVLLTYVISAILFFSVFSSLPIHFIVLGFFLIPYLILFIRKKYFPQSSVLSSIPFFVFGTLFFSLMLLLNNRQWNLDGLVVLIYFVLLNSAIGMGLYYLIRKFQKDFSRKEIKF